MQIPEFANGALMVISGFAGLILCMFWVHVRNLERKGRDQGFLYLGAGLLLWATMYALELGFPSQGNGAADQGHFFDRFLRRVLSTTNSALFLMTLPLFEHGFERWHGRLDFFHNPTKWRRVVLPAAATTLVLTLLTFRIFQDKQDEWLAGLPETIFSVVSIMSLGYAIVVSFWRRRLPSMAVLTAIVLLGLLVVQGAVPFLNSGGADGDNGDGWIYLLRVCTHTLLVMLFFALAFTWIRERFQEGQKSSGQMQDNGDPVDKEDARIFLGKNRQGRYIARLNWPSREIEQQEIELSAKKFQYLLLAAVRKLNGEYVHGNTDTAHLYGGNIHTSNAALTEAFNKALPELGEPLNWPEFIESKGKGSGQYRLALSPAAIALDHPTLSEDNDLRKIMSELPASPSEAI